MLFKKEAKTPACPKCKHKHHYIYSCWEKLPDETYKDEEGFTRIRRSLCQCDMTPEEQQLNTKELGLSVLSQLLNFKH